ncbi:MAG: CPBP family intramembrane metalloprotease [Lachnospiraceae bacterium]|nr:CPBP family intramembrane metalloprotease [Lachnospiraceae bacterium]
MNTKRVGWAYLWMTIAFVAISLFVSFFIPDMGIGMTALLSELCLLVPVLGFLFMGRVGIREQLHLKGIKLSTLLMVFVFHICTYPVVIAMNAFTMAITGDNAAMDITSQFDGESFFVIWLFVGVIGPLVEEFVFRGVLLGGLRTTGRIIAPTIISALLFGLIHMNINQFSYTLCMGIFWGLLIEASGSIVSTTVCHMTMNSFSILMAYLLEKGLGDFEEILAAGQSEVTAVSYVVTGLGFLFISIFTSALAILMLKVISINEGRTGCFENIFRKRLPAEKHGRLITIPLIAGMAIAAGFMLAFLFIDLFL